MKLDIENTQVGVAGEYLAAGELSLRGYVSSITLRNSRGIDIIVSNAEGTCSITVQVKTNGKGGRSWLLSKKSEPYSSERHVYIFVSIQGLGVRPDYFVVPSQEVVNQIQTNHQNWIRGRKRNGEPRKDSKMRKFRDPDGKYLEAWEIISQLLVKE